MVVGGFESDVVPDSGKTERRNIPSVNEFESDVVPDSGKTQRLLRYLPP